MKSNIKSAVFAILAAAAAAVTALFPLLFPITAFAASLCLGLSIGYSNKIIFPPIAAAAAFFSAFAVYGKIWPAIAILFVLIPSGAAIGFAMRHGGSINSAAMTTVVLTLVLAAAVLCSYTVENSDGFDPAQAMSGATETIDKVSAEVYDTLYEYGQAMEDESGGKYENPFSAFSKNEFITAVSAQVVYVSAVFISVYFLCVTAAGYFIIKAVVKKRGYDTSSFTDFERVSISRTTGVLYGIVILASIISSFTLSSASAAYIVIQVAYAVMSSVFFFSGLSVADYFLRVKVMSKGARTAAVIGLAAAGTIISPFFANIPNTIINIIGWMDSLGSIRRRIDGGDKI